VGWAKENVPGYEFVSDTVVDPINEGLKFIDEAILAPVYKPIDQFVQNTIPGGWATVGVLALAVAAPYATPYLAAATGGTAITTAAGTEAFFGALAAGASSSSAISAGISAQAALTTAALGSAALKGATIGGALGGTRAALTGQDIVKGVLTGAAMGGLTGGALSGVTQSLVTSGLSLKTAQAAAPMLLQASQSVAMGQDPVTVLKNVALSGAFDQLTGRLSQAALNNQINSTLTGIGLGAGTGAITSGIQGGDILGGATTGAIAGGVSSGINSLTAPSTAAPVTDRSERWTPPEGYGEELSDLTKRQWEAAAKMAAENAAGYFPEFNLNKDVVNRSVAETTDAFNAAKTAQEKLDAALESSEYVGAHNKAQQLQKSAQESFDKVKAAEKDYLDKIDKFNVNPNRTQEQLDEIKAVEANYKSLAEAYSKNYSEFDAANNALSNMYETNIKPLEVSVEKTGNTLTEALKKYETDYATLSKVADKLNVSLSQLDKITKGEMPSGMNMPTVSMSAPTATITPEQQYNNLSPAQKQYYDALVAPMPPGYTGTDTPLTPEQAMTEVRRSASDPNSDITITGVGQNLSPNPPITPEVEKSWLDRYGALIGIGSGTGGSGKEAFFGGSAAGDPNSPFTIIAFDSNQKKAEAIYQVDDIIASPNVPVEDKAVAAEIKKKMEAAPVTPPEEAVEEEERKKQEEEQKRLQAPVAGGGGTAGEQGNAAASDAAAKAAKDAADEAARLAREDIIRAGQDAENARIAEAKAKADADARARAEAMIAQEQAEAAAQQAAAQQAAAKAAQEAAAQQAAQEAADIAQQQAAQEAAAQQAAQEAAAQQAAQEAAAQQAAQEAAAQQAAQEAAAQQAAKLAAEKAAADAALANQTNAGQGSTGTGSTGTVGSGSTGTAGTGTAGTDTTGTGAGTTGTGSGTGTTGEGGGVAGTGTGTGSGSGSGSGTGSGSGSGTGTGGYYGYAQQSQDMYGGIKNLTPGLTQRMDYTLTGLPNIQETMNPMGDIPQMAAGGSTPSSFDPFNLGIKDAKIDGSLTPGLTKAQLNYILSGMPGNSIQTKAEGGLIEGHNPTFFSEGGLGSMDNQYVEGDGDGTSDSIAAMLADGEFVIPADVVADLGNGSNEAGASILNQLLIAIRQDRHPGSDGKLPKDSKGPLAYLLDAKRKVKA
jgi:hypothetical protein